jgi:hypothetical protein
VEEEGGVGVSRQLRVSERDVREDRALLPDFVEDPYPLLPQRRLVVEDSGAERGSLRELACLSYWCMRP